MPRHHKCTLPDGRELKIGEWLHTQRSYYHAGKLRGDRIAALQRLVDEGKLAWSLRWDLLPHTRESRVPLDLKWDAMFKELLRYGELKGNYNVPYLRADVKSAKKKRLEEANNAVGSVGSSSGGGNGANPSLPFAQQMQHHQIMSQQQQYLQQQQQLQQQQGQQQPPIMPLDGSQQGVNMMGMGYPMQGQAQQQQQQSLPISQTPQQQSQQLLGPVFFRGKTRSYVVSSYTQ